MLNRVHRIPSVMNKLVEPHLGFAPDISCLCPELGEMPGTRIAEDCGYTRTWT